MADAKPIRLPVRARERRTHAERTAETRARIIAAVVESIAEVGFARTTAAEITRRAGVTWGAVQHHFGDKHGILVAVLENSFDRFAAQLDDVSSEEASLEKRTSLFIDRAWEHIASPLYRSTFEILLDEAGREEVPDEPTWQQRLFSAWDRIWMRIFGDAPVSRRRQHVLQHYTLSVLSGLASVLTLESAGTRQPGAELELLKQSLTRELSRS